ncbi:MAG: hypothetical protein LBR84_08995 [Tannerella sp.]|jgi:hypothetical protein|nr:hypothetical protein [Tannerella sp.]
MDTKIVIKNFMLIAGLLMCGASCTVSEVLHSADPEDDEDVHLTNAWYAYTSNAHYYVAANGNDTTGNGSTSKPWATLTYAINNVPDVGCEIVVKTGHYRMGTIVCRTFEKGLTIRAEVPYKTVLQVPERMSHVFSILNSKDIIIRDFELVGNPDVADDYVMQITESDQLLIKNNIIHDTAGKALIKIWKSYGELIVQGNVFYNKDRECHNIIVDVASNVSIIDNVIFHNLEATGADVLKNPLPFISIGSSMHAADKFSKDIYVSCNIFLNWEGAPEQSFLTLGGGARTSYEVDNALIENNLFICNSYAHMASPFTVNDVKNVIFRANTVTGHIDHGLTGYGINVEHGSDTLLNDNVRLYNNIYSDPTGQMGVFAGGKSNLLKNSVISNNLVFNNGRQVSDNMTYSFTLSMDRTMVMADPMLERNVTVPVLPVWNGTYGQFESGGSTIDELRKILVEKYAGFTNSSSAAIDMADATNMPKYDILHHKRDSKPDIGAYEYQK